jgi:hypothetical protein
LLPEQQTWQSGRTAGQSSVRPRGCPVPSRPPLPSRSAALRAGDSEGIARSRHGAGRGIGQGSGRASGEFRAGTPLGVRGPGVRGAASRGPEAKTTSVCPRSLLVWKIFCKRPQDGSWKPTAVLIRIGASLFHYFSVLGPTTKSAGQILGQREKKSRVPLEVGNKKTQEKQNC